MITRLYANNFRCLVAFETQFDSFNVLCGPNGAGKSSVFDVLKFIQDLTGGDCFLGGDRERDVARLEVTNWLDSKIQEFELGVTAEGHAFTYLLHIEQVSSDLKPRIVRERATCDDKEIFNRNLEGVTFPKTAGGATGFPLDWRQAALGAIQPTPSRREVQILQHAIANLLILRPSPRGMEKESKAEARSPGLSLSNLTSWYRSLSLEQEWTDALRESLQEVWPDFRSFRQENVGLNTKMLQLRFEADTKEHEDEESESSDESSDSAGGESGSGGRVRSSSSSSSDNLMTALLSFGQLSDGEKALIGLYMIRTALATGAVKTVLIDEPDNYVGLPELQPWVLSLRELLDEEHQALIISHHPEVLGNAGQEFGRYLWRDNHTSPTRIGPLKVPPGLTAGEAVTRGWVSG
jgi:energy-coupling factor transporter ATP-binding protein EcfA2